MSAAGRTVRRVGAEDWAQVASAVFTAVAALAALVTVLRAEHDRRDRALPSFGVEVIQDVPKGEVRLYVVNYGGPAREVRVAGVLDTFGFTGPLGPTTYWRPGESRTALLSMPLVGSAPDAFVLVEARDVRKRYLLVATVGGATYRWPLRKARKLSLASVFHDLFPESPGPLDASHPNVHMETIERGW